MKGKIKAYSACVNAGLIICENGETYPFSKSEWNGKDLPVTHEVVSFNGETGQAKKVTNSQKIKK